MTREKKLRKSENSAPEFAGALNRQRAQKTYILRLYITGMTSRSQEAIKNIKQISEEYLHGRYDLEVIDIYQRPQLAKGEQIIAAPTLIKELPLPIRRFVGDLSDKEKVLLGLDIKPKDASSDK